VKLGGRTLSIIHPASAEDLISESDFDEDERLPYWAELWPSAKILGERLLAMEGAHRSLLELGCGAGLVATCASLSGFRVTASDYYDDALRFARVNAWRNSAGTLRGLLLDWRRPPARSAKYEVIVASDVLYERPYGALVARVIATMLAPKGRAFIADPGRVARDDFIAALAPLGLRVTARSESIYRERAIRQTITVLEIARERR
jgi:2-polyprenyl-3-methyl-5-hydroxy-6-metoxy-1,4-benzoquinol methylase